MMGKFKSSKPTRAERKAQKRAAKDAAKQAEHDSKEMAKEENAGKSSKTVINEMYNQKYKQYKKLVFNLGFGDGWEYKNTPEDVTLNKLYEFYDTCKDNDEALQKYMKMFWENTEWRKSTFLRVTVGDDYPVLEIYRDTDFMGNYELTQTVTLN